MSREPAGSDPASLNVVARRVLLDAVVALADHRDAVVLVGAQAVYLRTREADLTVALYTADGDLGLDPTRLGADPRLEQAMSGAGFSRQREGGQSQPGTWFRTEVVGQTTAAIAVDLLVPASLAAGGRRSATLPPHDSHAARRVPGLEAAIVDNSVLQVASLEPDVDHRSLPLQVAGIPALIIAKAWKLGERLEEPDARRAEAKDAGDLYRLMSTSDTDEVSTTLVALLDDDVAGDATATGLNYLVRFFGRRALPGIQLAQRALATAEDPDRIADLMTTYISLLPET
jgi:hypothetical protein